MHIATKLRSTLDEVIERAIYMVKRARNYTDDVEFSCEDAGRTPIADLARVVEAAINAGATTINIPDTVGYTMPFEFAGIISGLYERVPNIDKAIISVHTHDDLGLAVGNSLAAVHAGARQVEGAMNGIGERAGNCSLEEVIMAIKVRKDILNVHTAINHQEIWRTSQLVSQICNMPIPANKAIVGSGADLVLCPVGCNVAEVNSSRVGLVVKTSCDRSELRTGDRRIRIELAVAVTLYDAHSAQRRNRVVVPCAGCYVGVAVGLRRVALRVVIGQQTEEDGCYLSTGNAVLRTNGAVRIAYNISIVVIAVQAGRYIIRNGNGGLVAAPPEEDFFA